MWGEWIEIYNEKTSSLQDAGLSPCGESGLKCGRRDRRLCGGRSLPVWGEWIEIRSNQQTALMQQSLPVWGEWIEIRSVRRWAFRWIVSPRVGRVD